MGFPTPACPKCTRNCLLFHGKNKESSPVTSFFKVMITDNFSEVLFLPPKIAWTLRDLVNKEARLEDASGQRWTVTLSRCDGSLAFQKGWDSFSLEHALEVGDFMVFHYLLGSHFTVQIFGKNGCERVYFSGENGIRKKRRTIKSDGAKDGEYHSIDSNSLNKQGQGTSALSGSNMEIVTDNALNIGNGSPREMLNEEQLCIIGMDARHRHEDHRNSLYDLLDLEMQMTSDVDGTSRFLEHERSHCHGNRISTSQARADIVDKIPVTEKVVSMVVRHLEIPEVNEGFRTTERVVVSKKDPGTGNTVGKEQRKKTKSTGEKMKEVKTKQLETKIKVCGFTDAVNGKYPERKECDRSFNHPVKDENHVFKVVKTERDDTSEFASTDSVTISFMVTETKPFVEFPRSLPFFSSKGRPGLERKAVVLLRDPRSRLWPVMYQEKSGIKVLTSGWEAFVKANCVRPGDKCDFEVENKSESIYKVGIVRK